MKRSASEPGLNKLFSFSSSRCFLKEIENMFSVFLSSYRNTRESLGELEKAAETLACSPTSNAVPVIVTCFLFLKLVVLISRSANEYNGRKGLLG